MDTIIEEHIRKKSQTNIRDPLKEFSENKKKIRY